GTLKERLGPLLFQLPPYFRKDAPRLREFLDLLPRDRRAAFEFRHQSWFDEEVFGLLRDHQAVLCIAEAENDLEIPFVSSAHWGYLRLRRPDYGDPELKAWAERVREQNWQDTFIFFKHEEEGKGPAMAKRVLELAGYCELGSEAQMPSRTSQIAEVGKRRIELSNLTKVLFPDDNIVKAQLIEYYFKIAPTILAHVKGRPLSLVRYPDGIGGESFFQKNRPDWAPEWLEHVTLGEEKKDYVIATEDASLGWLANLACIESHHMHSRAPHFDKPDYIVYDFDPPENFKFPNVAELALKFKKHLEG